MADALLYLVLFHPCESKALSEIILLTGLESMRVMGEGWNRHPVLRRF